MGRDDLDLAVPFEHHLGWDVRKVRGCPDSQLPILVCAPAIELLACVDGTDVKLARIEGDPLAPSFRALERRSGARRGSVPTGCGRRGRHVGVPRSLDAFASDARGKGLKSAATLAAAVRVGAVTVGLALALETVALALAILAADVRPRLDAATNHECGGAEQDSTHVGRLYDTRGFTPKSGRWHLCEHLRRWPIDRILLLQRTARSPSLSPGFTSSRGR